MFVFQKCASPNRVIQIQDNAFNRRQVAVLLRRAAPVSGEAYKVGAKEYESGIAIGLRY